MIHKMKLWNETYQMIKEGKKTIEMRLNDEKRSLIKVGDIIEFTNNITLERLVCEVINIFKYPNFYELYSHHQKTSIGYCEENIADAKDMYLYYDKEQIEKYGVLAIEIKVV